MMKISNLSVKNLFLVFTLGVTAFSGVSIYGMNLPLVYGEDSEPLGKDHLVAILLEQGRSFEIIKWYCEAKKVAIPRKNALRIKFLLNNVVDIYLFCLDKQKEEQEKLIDVNFMLTMPPCSTTRLRPQITPLTAAILTGNENLVRELLIQEANPHQKLMSPVGDSITPFEFSIVRGSDKVNKIIRKYSKDCRVVGEIRRAQQSYEEMLSINSNQTRVGSSPLTDFFDVPAMRRRVEGFDKTSEKRTCAYQACEVLPERGGTGEIKNFFKCCTCHARYCSKQCQKADWKKHKTVCREPEEQDAPAAAAAGLFSDFVGRRVQERGVVEAGPSASVLQASQCAQCNRISAQNGGELFSCGRCRQIKYCSKKCQKAHWKAAHKHECHK